MIGSLAVVTTIVLLVLINSSQDNKKNADYISKKLYNIHSPQFIKLFIDYQDLDILINVQIKHKKEPPPKI